MEEKRPQRHCLGTRCGTSQPSLVWQCTTREAWIGHGGWAYPMKKPGKKRILLDKN
jgi:hypothetical protein